MHARREQALPAGRPSGPPEGAELSQPSNTVSIPLNPLLWRPLR
ncbi:uncharacterized protein SOCEGT47_031230 [Sorangium cellulosum]|jgi:hypothetical protein|uniref:Uncharacterized protein n=1 Tax=Sorangium cellulosum TaxID=56 RepID=A0A4P2Q0B9_SORCE|nr:uncharacterized protein SOCEGT47_031230 [Sorangium cellulosum]